MNRGKQVERYTVEQFKPVRRGQWAWVTIGDFPAVDAHEARHLARGATAQPLRFLRATLVGTLAPEPEVLR